MIIEAKSINSYYGKIQALFDVSFCLNDGEVISFIGANGAGKSTLMQSIVGLVKVGSGNIIFNGEDITNMPTHKIIKKGVVYVPEGRRIFPDLTVEENMIIGAHSRNDSEKAERGNGRDIRYVSQAKGTYQAKRRQLERWRAADAGYCKGSNGGPQAIDAG